MHRTKYTHHSNLSVLATLRKGCILLQDRAFFSTSLGLNVKCLPQVPVFEHLVPASSFGQFFRRWNLAKGSESLGVGLGALQMSSASCSSSSSSASCLWIRSDQLASCTCCHASPACCYVFSTMKDFIPLEL